MSIVRSLALVGISLFPIACDAVRPPIAPTSVPEETATSQHAKAPAKIAAAPGQTIPDLSGTWNWSEEVTLALPEWLGPIFGFTAEGPTTHIRCQDSGVMTVVQASDSFSGTATQASTCETRGGQVFVPAPFPSSIEIANGRIGGRSIHMLFGPPANEIPAPYVGTISEIVNGVATKMGGTGLAIPPGHPKSPLFVDPPAPPTKTITWQASRP
jgi:hypothetical protein